MESEPLIPTSARLTAFLSALPAAPEEQFVNAPGLGVFRAKYIRRGMERGVVAVHWTGLGLALVEPSTHGACSYCKGRKGSQPCDHCACALCSWFRQVDERASPRVSRQKLQALAHRLQHFEMGMAQPVTATALDDDLI